jgi:hypothetical protein
MSSLGRRQTEMRLVRPGSHVFLKRSAVTPFAFHYWRFTTMPNGGYVIVPCTETRRDPRAPECALTVFHFLQNVTGFLTPARAVPLVHERSIIRAMKTK